MRDPLVIHVVRHGRTRSNRVGVVMGWADESIEPDQHDAADAVAARLAAAPAPVRVVSSPLARARDTAAPLAAALSVDLETDATRKRASWSTSSPGDVDMRCASPLAQPDPAVGRRSGAGPATPTRHNGTASTSPKLRGADQKLLGGVAEFTPADDLSQGKPRASSGAE